MGSASLTSKESKVALGEVELQLIDLCVRVAQFIGLPKSVGEIYGLLFISPEPLCLDQCMERLQISQGSASQGIKLLRHLKAVKSVYVQGDRRDFYSAESGLGTLAQGFLTHRVLPGFEDLSQRLNDLEHHLANNPTSETERIQSRVGKVRDWLKQGSSLLNNAALLLSSPR